MVSAKGTTFMKSFSWWRIIKPLILAMSALILVNGFSFFYHFNYSNNSLSIFRAILLSVIFSEFLGIINRHLNKRFSWKSNPALRFLVQFIFDVGFILFFVLGYKLVLLIYYQHMSWQKFFRQEEFVNWTIVLVTLVLVLLDLGVFLIRQWKFSIVDLETSKRRMAEFQFEILRNQINPHFLFNSLNTLDALIFSSPARASDFTKQLAQVFRNVLELENTELISLEKELRLVDAYIKMMGIRYGENLSIDIKVQDTYREYFIPCLTIQLLIENALNHNIVSSLKPLQIAIYCEKESLVVRNTFQQKMEPIKSTGIGLKNISNRYWLSGNDAIRIYKDGYFFYVSLPLIKNK